MPVSGLGKLALFFFGFCGLTGAYLARAVLPGTGWFGGAAGTLVAALIVWFWGRRANGPAFEPDPATGAAKPRVVPHTIAFVPMQYAALPAILVAAVMTMGAMKMRAREETPFGAADALVDPYSLQLASGNGPLATRFARLIGESIAEPVGEYLREEEVDDAHAQPAAHVHLGRDAIVVLLRSRVIDGWSQEEIAALSRLAWARAATELIPFECHLRERISENPRLVVLLGDAVQYTAIVDGPLDGDAPEARSIFSRQAYEATVRTLDPVFAASARGAGSLEGLDRCPLEGRSVND